MNTVNESIYDHPKYYDLVFGSDYAAELQFIQDCAVGYASGRVSRMFEPACGTGRLIYQLARRGFTVGGLDLNPKAVGFCNDRLERWGFEDRVRVADMAHFREPRKWDLAFNTINSFRHLQTEAEADGHLDCMAKCIRKGGLYLLGVHLTPTSWSGSEGEDWSASRGRVSIKTHMWEVERDPQRRLERFGIRFDVRLPSRTFRIIDELVLRSYTAVQMDRFLQRGGQWEIVETFDFAYDIEAPIKVDGGSEDVVYVLRRI